MYGWVRSVSDLRGRCWETEQYKRFFMQAVPKKVMKKVV